MPELPPLQGLQPDTEHGLTVELLPRRQASLESNLCRKGVWHAGPLQLALPLEGDDVLGLVRVAGAPLTLFDLDVMAWLCERWREGERDQHGLLSFTLYELGRDLHGRKPSGRDRQEMRASLDRLYETSFELEGYRVEDAARGRLSDPVEGRRSGC